MKHILRSISVFLTAALIIPLFSGLRIEAATGIKIADSKNFPDANFRAVVKTYDSNKDGYLSDSEISGVTNIVCEGKKITSLKGIEYFTALQGLWCANNNIKTVNLKGNGFTVFVEDGQGVKKGDKLMTFDTAYVKANAPSDACLCVFTNLPEGKEVALLKNGNIKALEDAVEIK